MIRVFENAIDSSTCDSLIEYMKTFDESIPSSSKRNYVGENSLPEDVLSLYDGYKKRFYSGIVNNENPYLQNVVKSVSPRLIKFLSELELPEAVVELLMSLPPEFETWKVKKYPPGGYFSKHVDGYRYSGTDDLIPSDAKGTIKPGEWMAYEAEQARWTYHNRFIGIFCYLNTIEEGGETIFYNSSYNTTIYEHKSKLTVLPKQGTMVLFDFIENPVHEGRPVVGMDKWFLGSYFHVRGWRDV